MALAARPTPGRYRQATSGRFTKSWIIRRTLVRPNVSTGSAPYNLCHLRVACHFREKCLRSLRPITGGNHAQAGNLLGFGRSGGLGKLLGISETGAPLWFEGQCQPNDIHEMRLRLNLTVVDKPR